MPKLKNGNKRQDKIDVLVNRFRRKVKDQWVFQEWEDEFFEETVLENYRCYQEVKEDLKKDDNLIEDDRGKLKGNPLVLLMKMHYANFIMGLKHLGIRGYEKKTGGGYPLGKPRKLKE